MKVPGARTTPFQTWARGESCSFGRALLTSSDVTRGLSKPPRNEEHIYRAKGLVCGYDRVSLMCWAANLSGKPTDLAFHKAAIRADHIAIATPVEVQVSAPTAELAGYEVDRILAAKLRKKTSPARKWVGTCSLIPEADFLPGVRALLCEAIDLKAPTLCVGNPLLYRSGQAAGNPPAWRWDAIGGTDLPSCK